MNFLHELLGHVKESLVGTPDLSEVRFYWSPRLRRVVREESTGHGATTQKILPDWFVQNVLAGGR